MITEKIRQLLPKLKKNDTVIANYILENAEAVTRQNIQGVADTCKTSPSAIYRFCRHLGIKGFPDLRILLAEEITETKVERKRVKATAKKTKVVNYAKLASEHIITIPTVLSEEALKNAANIIINANHILLVGMGPSFLVAKDLQQKFIGLGLFASCLENIELGVVESSCLKEGDICIVVSYSGESTLPLLCAEEAKKNGATIIAITKKQPSSLNAKADICLDIPIGEGKFRESPSLSRISQFVISDMLYSELVVLIKETKGQLLDLVNEVPGK